MQSIALSEVEMLKEEKQQRSSYAAPPAVEATLQHEKRESEQTTIMSFSTSFG